MARTSYGKSKLLDKFWGKFNKHALAFNLHFINTCTLNFLSLDNAQLLSSTPYTRHGQSDALQLIFAALGPFSVMKKAT